MKKKGLSTIVVSVLIIGLVLVALGIVWLIISGILESSKEEAEFGQSKINLKLSSVFIDSSSISLKVSRLTGVGSMSGLNFVFSDGRNSEIVENVSSLGELEEKTFYMGLTKLRYSELRTVSVAPTIILSSGDKRIGNVLDTYTIRAGNYNRSFYDDSEGGEACVIDSDCPPEIEGSDDCNLTTGNISTHWTVHFCSLSGRCVSNEEIRLSEYCLNGCFVGNDTCIPVQCNSFSDCGVNGRIGYWFCNAVSGDLYENYISWSCINNVCSSDISERVARDCYDLGCTCGPDCLSSMADAECFPSLECDFDSDCLEFYGEDSFVPGSQYCGNGTDVWMNWRDNFCPSNFNCINNSHKCCTNNISQRFNNSCSENPGPYWSCMGGSCVQGDCSQDICNPFGTCGKICVNKTCIVETPIDSGTVLSIWPLDKGEYFDSNYLPKTESEGFYYLNFTKFTSGGALGSCFGIKEHVYSNNPEENSYLRFDVSETEIGGGDAYEIWKTKFNCECPTP